MSSDGLENLVYYQNPENESTVVKFTAGDKDITSHSKTDSFGRKVFDELQLGTGFVSRQFSYHAGEVTEEHSDNEKLKSSATTRLVSQIVFSGGRSISYEYDTEERITRVIDSVEGVTEYTYDAQGQLLSETNDGVAVNTMTYDAYGNILTKNGKAYTYGDSTWKDLLTSYDGQSIAYDAQGNPTSYLGHTLAWEKGRQLKSFDSNTYTYNANGVRTSKTVNGVQHTYTLEGSKILREVWGSNTLVPLYDNESSVCGIIYNDTPYYFFKNLQGDIISITDMDGDVIARYSYDAWGVCTITQDSSTVGIASINPYRYRGYYFDGEIGLYYLQSRYYNPTIGRFINVDGLIVWGMIDPTLTSCNLFSYTHNDPINHTDYWGYMEFSSNDNYFVFAFNDWETVLFIIALDLGIAAVGFSVAVLSAVAAPATGGTSLAATKLIAEITGAIMALVSITLVLINHLGGNKGINVNIPKNIWSRPYIWYNQTEPDGPHNLDELWARIKQHVAAIVETCGYVELRKLALMSDNNAVVQLSKMIISEYKRIPVVMPPIC